MSPAGGAAAAVVAAPVPTPQSECGELRRCGELRTVSENRPSNALGCVFTAPNNDTRVVNVSAVTHAGKARLQYREEGPGRHGRVRAELISASQSCECDAAWQTQGGLRACNRRSLVSSSSSTHGTSLSTRDGKYLLEGVHDGVTDFALQRAVRRLSGARDDTRRAGHRIT